MSAEANPQKSGLVDEAACARRLRLGKSPPRDSMFS
jgi:hypothetical protein